MSYESSIDRAKITRRGWDKYRAATGVTEARADSVNAASETGKRCGMVWKVRETFGDAFNSPE